jgi:hypothetical protein
MKIDRGKANDMVNGNKFNNLLQLEFYALSQDICLKISRHFNHTKSLGVAEDDNRAA